MILREGVPPIVVACIAGSVAQALFGPVVSLPVAACAVAMVWLYWERRPVLPSEPRTAVAPVRGRVVDIARDRDPWLDRDVLRVRIALRFPGILPVRGPIEGKVMELFTACGVPGETLRECGPRESPDCYAQWVRTDEGEDVVCALSSRWPFSRARFRQSPGERVGHGKRAGFIYFASIVDVLVPADSVSRTDVGQPLVSGVTGLAELRRS